MSHEHKCHAVTHCSAAIISMYSRGSQTFSHHGPLSREIITGHRPRFDFDPKHLGRGGKIFVVVVG